MSILSHVPARVSDRRPSAAGRRAPSGLDLAMAQRAELHLDLSDEPLRKLAVHAQTSVASCLECGHAVGCDCDCCPFPLPAVAGSQDRAAKQAASISARPKKTGRKPRVDHEAVKALYLGMFTADGSCLSSRALALLAGCSQSTSCRIIREIHRESQAVAA
ncbi:hypothetical protein GCM10009839_86640 [Catenulispora yoronensis]|uniref:Helix-turn-helix domain-containing protein n=1 Tax=Catenulispora yoronensis TaxID=450799 RepID=A0ABN2VGY0_9ACTN